jgi:hypothetical protein
MCRLCLHLRAFGFGQLIEQRRRWNSIVLPRLGVLRQNSGSGRGKKVTDCHAAGPAPAVKKDDLNTVHGAEYLGHFKEFTIVGDTGTHTHPDARGRHRRSQICWPESNGCFRSVTRRPVQSR